eukprot:jgi/Galph1/2274/GphlegSOOS_G919.1
MSVSKEERENYKIGNMEPQVVTARAQLQHLLARDNLHLKHSTEDKNAATLDSLAEEFDEALNSLSIDTNSAVRLLSEARAVAEDRLGLTSANIANMEETFAELPLAKVRSSAAVFSRLLEESRDEQVLRETCLGLCQLFGDGIQNDRIQAILEADVVPKLIALLKPQETAEGIRFPVSIAVQSAALQVIGNVACGDDRQTQIIIECNALPCLKVLLSSPEKGIRKECCWIISNITESAHQVEDVIEADILPSLIQLIDNNDAACREDASWVLYNITANFDESQIQYLVEKGGIVSFCNLLDSTKELDVFWKCCSTISSIALKGLRNILFVGEQLARSQGKRYNPYAALVVECNGVEKIEMLAQSSNMELVRRATSIIQTFFGTESIATTATIKKRVSSLPNITDSTLEKKDIGANVEWEPSESDESVCSELDDDLSDHELLPPALGPCQCVLCSDTSPLIDKKSMKGTEETSKRSTEDSLNLAQNSQDFSACEFVTPGQYSTRAIFAGKLGRCVRMGHSHCLAVILSRMKWSERSAAIETPASVRPFLNKANNRSSSLFNANSLPETSLPAFVLAAKLGKPLCLEKIIRKCKPELDATFGRKRLTALAWASYRGYFRCCQILLQNGANSQARCADGLTALHLAASSGYSQIVSLLLEHGAQVDIKSAKGQTPLFHACQKGHSSIVQMLLAAGANANAQDEQQLVPLHLAALCGQAECSKVLILEGKAQVDKKNANDITPLHYAVRGGHVEVVRCLLENGANVAPAGLGGPLLFVAIENGDIECVKALIEYVNQTATIKLLIHKDYETNDCLVPLALAASKGYADIVELLIQQDADIHAKSMKGWTSLELAVLNGHTACVKILLYYGAVVDEKVKTMGKTCLTLVQFAARYGHREIVRLLVERLKNRQGNKDIDSEVVEKQERTRSTSGHSWEGVVEEQLTVSTGIGSSSCTTDNNQSSTLQKRRPQRELGKGNVSGEDFFKRERRRKELEANEVLTKIEEAISCKSIPKLTDSIAHANKLLLQIAALRPDTQNIGEMKEEKVVKVSTNGGNTEESTKSISGSSFTYGAGPCNESEKSQIPIAEVANEASRHHPLSLGRKLEYYLSKNIQKAREMLLRIQDEEKRWKEEKMEMEKRLNQEQARKQLSEALCLLERIGDYKALNRALKRAERLKMTEDSLYQEAYQWQESVKRAMEVVKCMQSARMNEDVEKTREYMDNGRELKKSLPEKLAHKIFEEHAILENIEKWVAERELEQQAAREAQKRKQEEENLLINRANISLQETNSDGSSYNEMETLMKEMDQFMNEHGEQLSNELKSTADAVKKKLGKVVKAERKKLKQLCSSDDSDWIEKECERIRSLGLKTLQRDIQEAEQHVKRLRATRETFENFQSALELNDLESMKKWRADMESLGMVNEAEEARVIIEQRRREAFIKTQLETFLQETGEILEADPSSMDRWPEGRRLSSLCKKASKYPTLKDLVSKGYIMGRRLGEWCRTKLESKIESDDPKQISDAVENFSQAVGGEYNQSQDSLWFDNMFDSTLCEVVWKQAQQQLVDSQNRIQEKVWMELASNRLESNGEEKSTSEGRERSENHSDLASLSVDSVVVEDDNMDALNTQRDIFMQDEKTETIDQQKVQRVENLTYSPRRTNEITAQKQEIFVADEVAYKNRMDSGCVHYYVWLHGNQVICNKCKNIRTSQNAEWIERVKRRTSREESNKGISIAKVYSRNEENLMDNQYLDYGVYSSQRQSNHSTSATYSKPSSLLLPSFVHSPTKSEQSVPFGNFIASSPSTPQTRTKHEHVGSYYSETKSSPSSLLFPSLSNNDHALSLDHSIEWNHYSSNDHQDISEEFAKENFGFHIEDIVDEDTGR